MDRARLERQRRELALEHALQVCDVEAQNERKGVERFACAGGEEIVRSVVALGRPLEPLALDSAPGARRGRAGGRRRAAFDLYGCAGGNGSWLT